MGTSCRDRLLAAGQMPTQPYQDPWVQAGQSRPAQLPGGSDSWAISGNSHSSWILGSSSLPVFNTKKAFCWWGSFDSPQQGIAQ